VCGRNLITGLTSAASPRVDISSTCKVGKKLGVSPSADMLPFGVTIPATVPQRSEIPEGPMNYPVYNPKKKQKIWRKQRYRKENFTTHKDINPLDL
jgi:hypothetical protein